MRGSQRRAALCRSGAWASTAGRARAGIKSSRRSAALSALAASGWATNDEVARPAGSRAAGGRFRATCRLMRLRPTACLSTFWTRRRRAGPRVASAETGHAGGSRRRKCVFASLEHRPGTRPRRASRARRGKRASGRGGHGPCFDDEHRLRRTQPAIQTQQAGAALGTATRQDLAAVGGRHAGTETVVALTLEVAGLVGALGGHGGTSIQL